MSFLTLDMSELECRWMQIYINVMMLKSHNPKAKEILDAYQIKIAEVNETMMSFFEEWKGT